MKKFTRLRSAVLGTLLLLLAIGLVACSDDTITSPADPATSQTLDDVWQTEVDALAAQVGAEVMEELAPQLEQARASLGDVALKHGRRFYLAFATTTFDEEFIYSDGWSTVTGPHTAISASEADYTHDPPIQTTVTTITDGDGEDLVLLTDGFFTIAEDGLAIEFWGGGDFDGGTGRYEDASGSVRYFGDASFITATGRILYYGWISLGH